MVLKIPKHLAPVNVAILPLLKKDGLNHLARDVFNDLKSNFKCHYEEKDSIGKRYRRQDAIGTPLCITIDHETIKDNQVTIRDRDTMRQERVEIKNLPILIKERLGI